MINLFISPSGSAFGRELTPHLQNGHELTPQHLRNGQDLTPKHLQNGHDLPPQHLGKLFCGTEKKPPQAARCDDKVSTSRPLPKTVEG